jgi:hypothetical protein
MGTLILTKLGYELRVYTNEQIVFLGVHQSIEAAKQRYAEWLLLTDSIKD